MKKSDGIRMATVMVAFLSAFAFMGPGMCTVGLQRWFSTNPAPDMRGDWDVTYDDRIDVEIDIGGSLYNGSITGESGTISFTHDGNPVDLPLDCSYAWVVCPSEVFPATVTLEQRQFQERPHQVHMTLNSTECAGTPRLPDEASGECDPADEQRPCDVEICDDVVTTTKTTIGTISDPGDTIQRHPDFDLNLLLGGDFAMPTANCVLTSWSIAQADIVYTGDYDVDATEPEMMGESLTGGEIITEYGGACFWFEEDYTGDLRAALLGATITLTTGFTAEKQ